MKKKIEIIANKIKVLILNIESQNLSFVGNGIENSSMVRNSDEVSRAIRYSLEGLDEVLWHYQSGNLLEQYINYMNELKNKYANSNYDNDGIGVGTMVDVIKGVETMLNN